MDETFTASEYKEEQDQMTIPVIDLFAGPGGLGEGFSRAAKQIFKVVISIEKDGMARETLRLRAAHRKLMQNPEAVANTWQLWDSVIESQPWNVVFSALQSCGDPMIMEACLHADNEALELELGPNQRDTVSAEVRKRLKPFMKNGRLPSNAVLIGGPPCQAYSVVGRSRNRGQKDYVPENDKRHFLYEEYLHVISEFKPAIFVMENVKGILSSRVDDGQIFNQILSDLRRPSLTDGEDNKLEYVLVSLGDQTENRTPAPEDFIIKAEEFGIPQARHRVIILGVRRDVYDVAGNIAPLRPTPPPSVQQVLSDLPSLRPEISTRGRGMTWIDALHLPLFDDAVHELNSGSKQARAIASLMVKCRTDLSVRQHDPGSGSDRTRLPESDRRKKLRALVDWYRDRTTNLLANHESRSHMPSDLVRYMFVSAFGKITKDQSPKLVDFPKCLLPAHKNVDPNNVSDSIFKDRFRVQVGSRHSMTITSHIAKDGHAFIHFKPKQCRSLTVREAARLQTFPDSYVFLGNRTSQYTQVGNAVPPRLAYQVAEAVAGILQRANLA